MPPTEQTQHGRILLPGRSWIGLGSRQTRPLRSIGLRALIAVSCLVVTALIVYLDRKGYRDGETTGTLSLLDAFYYSSVSLSTTGYGDITPVSEPARLFNILVITPLRFLFLLVLVGTTIEVLARRGSTELREQRWRKSVRDHTVIIGFGLKGRSALDALLNAGIPASEMVVLTTNPDAAEEATSLGVTAMLGDGRRQDVLKQVHIERAARVVVAVDADDNAVLVTLAVRLLAPHAMVVGSARESVNAELLRRSGADQVITSAESAGRMLGLMLLSPAAGSVMEDLIDPGRGLDISERPVAPEEEGLTLEQLPGVHVVLAVVRGSEVRRFDELDGSKLQRGDRLVVIRSNDSAAAGFSPRPAAEPSPG